MNITCLYVDIHGLTDIYIFIFVNWKKSFVTTVQVLSRLLDKLWEINE